MKFNIHKIILWLKGGKTREIEFLPNKVNVITGASNTGKTAILEIIDYCFFASESKISESMINENVLWYGLVLNINNNKYTLARKKLNNTKVSADYYFSSIGETPEKLHSNNTENSIKMIIESEFSIDRDVAIPYGSDFIQPGSKISLRYFLLFNSISGNIIENDSGIFFDKQSNPRYRDALPRIFDLAVGIESVENVLKKEKKLELQKIISRLTKKNKTLTEKSDVFIQEKEKLIKKAKEHSLIPSDLDFNCSIEELQNAIDLEESQSGDISQRSKLEKEYYLLERKIKNLNNFSSEYDNYKKNLLTTEDYIKPIEFLKEKDKELLKTSIFKDVINAYSAELVQIKKSRKKNTPINKQVNDAIKEFEVKLEKIKKELAILPEKTRNFGDHKAKYIFLGEIKAKLKIFSKDEKSLSTKTDNEIIDLTKKLDLIEVLDTTEKKSLTIRVTEEIISEYIDSASDALENYAKYKPVFDYENKSLLLRKPKSNSIENIGSSSNHMFLHLFFSLAMQEVSFVNNSKYVAPYLVIDQPSRPYYGDESQSSNSNITHSDEFKITKAFELLNTFIQTRIENKSEFQMIVFEHVPLKIFKGLKHIHIVEEFRDGNALIPEELLS